MLSQEPTIAGQATATSLTWLASPFKSFTPDSLKKIKDLQGWRTGVYVGYGDWNQNLGPVDVWYYAPSTGQFVNSYRLEDEDALDSYVVIGEDLYIPGTDPKGPWSRGFFYVNDGSGWVQHEIPNAIHAFDMAGLDGSLFAALGAGTYGLQRSTDGGVTWTPALASKDTRRYYSLYCLGGGVFAPRNPSSEPYRQLGEDCRVAVAPDGKSLVVYRWNGVLSYQLGQRGSPRWGGQKSFNDRGVPGGVVLDAAGGCVEVHEGRGHLWYRVGRRNDASGTVTWGPSTRYADGEAPTLALDENAHCVEIHRDADNNLFHLVGRVDFTAKAIHWGAQAFLASGSAPSVGMDDSGRAVVVYQGEDEAIFVRVGSVDFTGETIAWGPSLPGGTGVPCGVALNNKGTCVEVYTKDSSTYSVVGTLYGPNALVWGPPQSHGEKHLTGIALDDGTGFLGAAIDDGMVDVMEGVVDVAQRKVIAIGAQRLTSVSPGRVAIDGDRRILEVHGENGGRVYSLGNADVSRFGIDWSDPVQGGTGAPCSVAMSPDHHCVEVYTLGGKLFVRVGEVDFEQTVLTWQKSVAVDGVMGSVAMDNGGHLLLLCAMAGALFARAGTADLLTGNIVWGPVQQYEPAASKGAIALDAGGNCLASHSLNGMRYYRCGKLDVARSQVTWAPSVACGAGADGAVTLGANGRCVQIVERDDGLYTSSGIFDAESLSVSWGPMVRYREGSPGGVALSATGNCVEVGRNDVLTCRLGRWAPDGPKLWTLASPIVYQYFPEKGRFEPTTIVLAPSGVSCVTDMPSRDAALYLSGGEVWAVTPGANGRSSLAGHTFIDMKYAEQKVYALAADSASQFVVYATSDAATWHVAANGTNPKDGLTALGILGTYFYLGTNGGDIGRGLISQPAE